MTFLKSVLPKIEVNYNAFETKEMLYFQKNILWVVFGQKIVVILEKSNFVQNCPILAGFIQF